MGLVQFSLESALAKARSLTKKGEVDQAKSIYHSILLTYPKNIRVQKALQNLDLKKIKPHNKTPTSDIINSLVRMYDQRLYEELLEKTQILIKNLSLK